MTCISPIAPFGEIARGSPKLSTRIALRNAEPLRSLRDKGREGTGGGWAGRALSRRRPRARQRLGGCRGNDKDCRDTDRNLKQRAPGAVPPAPELRRNAPS